MIIRDLFHTPSRFLRSAHLERDFDDVAALRAYILTPPVVDAMQRVLEGLRPGSKRRAWRLTGDYGSGKSSFALVLAHFLRDPRSTSLAHVRRAVDLRGSGVRSPEMLPILVTGSREGIVLAVARGVGEAVRRLDHPQAGEVAAAAAGVAERGDTGALIALVERTTAFAVGAGKTGAVLVIDEMGKLLEHAALHPEREDVFVLQRLAEVADRSGSEPLVLLGILHHGFHAYAERLPAAARHEWEKVAERFQEIVFDQPLAHVAALVSGALGGDADRMPAEVRESRPAVLREVAGSGWFAGPDAVPDPIGHYPIHPTVLPVMARFFGRFGQHERTLFSFLLSSEPFALQAFAIRRPGAAEWFRLPDLYDYVRAVFGYRLSGAGPRSQWARLIETMDGLQDVSLQELRILKSVALLNLLDAEDLLPTRPLLEAALGEASLEAALERLTSRRVLHRRGSTVSYCLWPTTSVNLDGAYRAAEHALGPLAVVSAELGLHLERTMLQARRHYIEYGTLRHFEVRYVRLPELEAGAQGPSNADGRIVVVLCEDERERVRARAFAAGRDAQAHDDLIIAVPQPLAGLRGDLQEVRIWDWVLHHTPELAQDAYGAAEVRRQLSDAQHRLRERLSAFVSFGPGPAAVSTQWFRAGERLSVSEERGLLGALSPVCDLLYPRAPRIENELLNRRVLSSAAAAARMRLVERMLAAPEEPGLGMDPAKAPPERSMYLSVLAAGQVHRETAGGWALAVPAEGDDPLHLRPALRLVVERLEAAGDHRVPVPELMARLREKPYGVRDGVIPLLLAIVLAAHAHEIAVYENGTFVQRFGSAEFLRMTKLPMAFELQLCRIAGVRGEVFERLVELVAAAPEGREADVLDVVTPLCVFAAELPAYTRQTSDLPPATLAVRATLLGAREPAALLFRDLPIACGLPAFPTDGRAEGTSAVEFASRLRDAMDTLRAAYPALLERIRARVCQAVGAPADADRGALAELAQTAVAVREPRLRAFALRLADTALGDEAWTEALASMVALKPPARWSNGDEARCGDELDVLGTTFRRVRAIHFTEHAPGAAVRVALTRGDGTERAEVVDLEWGVPEEERARADALRALLPADPRARLALLAQLLHEALPTEENEVLAEEVCR